MGRINLTVSRNLVTKEKKSPNLLTEDPNRKDLSGHLLMQYGLIIPYSPHSVTYVTLIETKKPVTLTQT